MYLRTAYTQPENSGTHFLIPWVQRAILFDVRIKPRVRRIA